MDRRTFLKRAALGTVTLGMANGAAAAEKYFPVKADQSLFQTINRAKDPAKMSPLEKKHVPSISAPAKVKSGEPFTVKVTIGETVHPMGPTHWIEYVTLSIGNEPAGRVDFQSRGFLEPIVTFSIVLGKDAAPDGKVTLIAHERCNLHGYWEGSVDVTVA